MKYVIIIGLIIISLFFIILSFIPIGIEPLTELYFDDHLQLPDSIDIDKEYEFSFVIHNLENEKMTYFYKISMEYNDEKRIIEVDQITLNNDENAIITSSFNIEEDFDRAKIEIKLLNIEQNIHFWVNQK